MRTYTNLDGFVAELDDPESPVFLGPECAECLGTCEDERDEVVRPLIGRHVAHDGLPRAA